jgi:hypothetical protein
MVNQRLFSGNNEAVRLILNSLFLDFYDTAQSAIRIGGQIDDYAGAFDLDNA